MQETDDPHKPRQCSGRGTARAGHTILSQGLPPGGHGSDQGATPPVTGGFGEINDTRDDEEFR